MQPIANTTARNGDQVSIVLYDGLADLTTYTLSGRMTAGTGTAEGVYGPPAELQISEVELEISGKTIQKINNYHDIYNIIRQYSGFDKFSIRQALQNEGTQPVSGTSAGYALSNKPFQISSWVGALGTIKVLDTIRAGTTVVKTRLAGTEIMTVHAANILTANRALTWTNIKARCDYLDLDDGLYHAYISKLLSANQTIDLAFDDYKVVTGTVGSVTQSTQFSTSGDCITDLWAFVKPTGSVAFNSNVANSNTLLSSYFTRGGGDNNTTQIVDCQYLINGVNFPSQRVVVSDGDLLQDTMVALNEHNNVLGSCDPGMVSLPLCSSNYFLHAVSLTHPDNNGGQKLIGLPSAGGVIQGSWSTSGSGSNIWPHIVLRGKSVMHIAANRVVQVTPGV
jgi:hypothetical protein